MPSLIANRRLHRGQWWRSRLAPGAKVAIIGDSMAQVNSYGNSAGQLLYRTTTGEVTWAWQIKPSFHFENWINTADTRQARYHSGANFGVGGDTAAQTETRLIVDKEVWPSQPDVLIVGVGTNSVFDGVSALTIITTLKNICENAAAKGIRVVLGNIPPRATSGSVATTDTFNAAYAIAAADGRWAVRAAVNEWVALYANPRERPVWFWDRTLNTQDPSPASGQVGDVKALFTVDGLHWSSVGAYWSGKTLATVLADIIDPYPWFDTNPANSNLASAGDFNGTGGSFFNDPVTGFAGTMATGRYTYRTTGPTNAGRKITGSQEGSGVGTKQVFTFTSITAGAPPAQDEWLTTFDASMIDISGYPDGTYFQSFLNVDVAGSNWHQLYLNMQTQDVSSVMQRYQLGNSFYGAGTEQAIGEDLTDIWLAIEPIKKTSGVTKLAPALWFRQKSSGASGTDVLKISREIIRIVDSPETRWPVA